MDCISNKRFITSEFCTTLLPFLDTTHMIRWSTLRNSNSTLRATGMPWLFITDYEGHISFSSDFISAFQMFRFSSAAIDPHVGSWCGLLSRGHSRAAPLLWAICCAGSGACTAAWWNRLRNWSGWKINITKKRQVISPQELCLGWLAVTSSQL